MLLISEFAVIVMGVKYIHQIFELCTPYKLYPLAGFSIQQGAKSVYAIPYSFVYPTEMLFVLQSTLEVLWENPVISAQRKGSQTLLFMNPWNFAESRGSRSWAGVVLYMGFPPFLWVPKCVFLYMAKRRQQKCKNELSTRALFLSLSISREKVRQAKESEQRAEQNREREEPH